MTQRDIIVIGGSAGAIAPLRTVLHALPTEFPAVVIVVLHRTAEASNPESLADAFRNVSTPNVHTAEDGGGLKTGHVYVAPPDRHLLLEDGLLRLEDSPKDHYVRPSIDTLFKSAASAYGRRVVAVLLSGRFGTDGTSGMWQVKEHGGVTIVQDPVTTNFDVIVRNALENVAIDYILSADEIAPRLVELTSDDVLFTRQTRAPRIMIAENDTDMATHLQEQIIELGYEPARWVTSGEEALAVVRAVHPDLILMDIRLSGRMSGVEAARQIWRKLQIPVVYCTSLSDIATLQSVTRIETYGYIVKPFHTPALRAAIELALSRRDKQLTRLAS